MTAQDRAKLIKLRWLFGFVFLGLMAQFLFTRSSAQFVEQPCQIRQMNMGH